MLTMRLYGLRRQNNRPGFRRRPRQRGGVVLAMLVLMVVTLIGLGLLARSQGSLQASAVSSRSDRAVLAAQFGVAEATARIVAGERADFSGSGALLEGSFTYQAIASGPSRFDVQSSATVDRVTRTIRVVIAGQAVGSEVLFVDQQATIRGPSVVIEGQIGTNGVLDVGDGARVDTVALYGNGASCTGCLSTVSLPGPQGLPGAPPLGPKTQNCPKDGLFDKKINGKRGRPIDCRGIDIEFIGQILIVGGRAVIHVDDSSSISFNGADVNEAGVPGEFQLYAAGSVGTIDIGSSSIVGILIAPGRAVTISDARLEGSLVAGSLDADPASSVLITPDSTNTSDYLRSWVVVSWEQVASP